MQENLAPFDKEWIEREPENILPYDGETVYYGPIFGADQAADYLNYFLNDVPWKNDEMMMYGKHIVTPRKIAWYGDKDYDYTYSNKTRTALPWPAPILEIKKVVEDITGVAYNSCLLNLYESGEHGMSWHHDNEKELTEGAGIASVSFGAERRFDLRHDDNKKTVSIVLEAGSLLVMKGETQKHWRHQVPKSKRIRGPRVNLTFRKMRQPEPIPSANAATEN